MADIEGKFIHELTDEQNSYDPEIELAADKVGLASTRKMQVGVIYPKTNTLADAGTIDPDTVLVRLDNGSGAESSLSVADLIDNAVSFSQNITGTPTSGHFNNVVVNARRQGRVVEVSATYDNTEWDSEQFFGTIENYVSPGYVKRFTVLDQDGSPSGPGRVDTSGNIYIRNTEDNQEWQFGFTVIMGNS